MLYLEHAVLSSYCDSFSLGLQNLTQISTLAAEEARGNVHSGAPPLWFEATEEIQIDVQLNSTIGSLIFPNKSGKSKKFNLQRAGAAKEKDGAGDGEERRDVKSDCTS